VVAPTSAAGAASGDIRAEPEKCCAPSRRRTAEPSSSASTADTSGRSSEGEPSCAGAADPSLDASFWRNTAANAADSPAAATRQAAPVPEVSEEPPFPKSRPGRFALRLLHALIFAGCIAATHLVLGVRSFLARFVGGTRRAPQLRRPAARLSWETLESASDPREAARAALPAPPPLPTPPPGGLQISFGPCANLMIYTGGVACCLQRCPNYAEVSPHLRFYGVSCGAFIASCMAADCDLLSMLPEMIAWTKKFQNRLWGLIGAYSESISAIVWDIFSDPSRFERATGRLGIGVTLFCPQPERVVLRDFESAADLATTLLGSCYIPVAFETPQWSDTMGPLWDGGILEFATQGDIVVSPFANVLPDVVPDAPYPRSFTFFPPHECDAVRLFEDGYMDCLRWLEAGAPSKRQAREQLVGATGSGVWPLLTEARAFLYDILWRKAPNCESKEHQS